MTEASTDLVGLVRSIVVPLVVDKDAVSVTSTMADDGVELIEIRVAPDDAGKVIGRQGRVIKSIRVLARAAAYGNNQHDVDIELVED